MTRNRRRLGGLAAVSLAMLLALALAACGSSSSSGSGGAASSLPAPVVKALSHLTTCMSAHGVKVPSPVTKKGVRTTIRDLPSAKRTSILTGCRTQINALLALRPGR